MVVERVVVTRCDVMGDPPVILAVPIPVVTGTGLMWVWVWVDPKIPVGYP